MEILTKKKKKNVIEKKLLHNEFLRMANIAYWENDSTHLKWCLIMCP